MKLGVRRDKLDEIQGVRHKVEAFERLLKANPKFQGKLLGRRDTHFNSAFPPPTYQPVVFLHVQEVTFSPYLVLLTVADAFTVTGLTEGTHKYVECHEEKKRVLILNEYDISSYAPDFTTSRTSDEEAASHWQGLHNHVVTAQAFVTSFLTQCLRERTENAPLSIDPLLVPPLDLPRLIPKDRHSPTRLVFVDLEGCPWVRDTSKSTMIEMMRSGRGPMVEPPEATTQGALERLAERVPSVGIVVESGCFVKTGEIGKKSNGQANGARWISVVANLDFAWNGPCIEIVNYFTERTPGSFVEELATSIVWRCWVGPPDSIVSIDCDSSITTATTTTNDASPATAIALFRP
ncbi:hypothetical protein EDD15DRAFT_2368057 [Pisolithus albus]|nr:hypothetical protein EDD15DRAFT_2368057 [Pisolithus albus]